MRHTRSTLTTKAMMDKTLTFQTKAMTRPMMRKKMMNLLRRHKPE
jgi:hypothetical protein